MIRRRHQYRKHIAPIAFGLAIAASIALSIGDIQRKSVGMRAISDNANAAMFQQMELELSTEQIAKQQAISKQRIEKFKCVAVVDRNGNMLATLQPNAVALNRGLSANLAPGTCVVGANGETGIIGNEGKITAIAAGLPEYAEKAIRRVSGAKVYYYYPEVK